jgi:hypothetical protein
MTLARPAVLAVFAIACCTSAAVADEAATGPSGGCALQPFALAVDTAGNGVLEPNETPVVAPSWTNACINPTNAPGTMSNHTGPAGPVYTIPDNTGSYILPMFGTGSCTTSGNCYSVRASTAARPATHWDSTVVETLSFMWIKTWRLHIGGSFTDVPISSPFYRFVETILHKGVTGGCTATTYCPATSTTRDQMAVFVLLSKEPAGYMPPACGATPMFTDVPVSSPFCRWVEELARRGVTSGCATGLYCPATAVTRDQMAVFVLRTLNPALSPPACGTPVFADVPAANPFCRWIEELVRRGVVSGCGGGNYCPAAVVTRDQMAVFLTGTFGLTLYGL